MVAQQRSRHSHIELAEMFGRNRAAENRAASSTICSMGIESIYIISARLQYAHIHEGGWEPVESFGKGRIAEIFP